MLDRAPRSARTAPRSARSAAVGAVLIALLALTGCQGGPSAGTSGEGSESVSLPPLSEVTALADPHSYEGPTDVLVGGPTVGPVAEDPTPELPVTVPSYDRDGTREITVDSADRVLALSLTGNLADMVHALGLSDRLIGRDLSTSFPGAEELPVVTKSSHSLDAESVLNLNPSVILTDGTIGPHDVLLQLRDAGIPVVMVQEATDFTAAGETARQVAAALGVPALGDTLATNLESAIEAKLAEIADFAPTAEEQKLRVAFLYIRGTSGIYYLFGQGSGIDTVIDAIGGIDVTEEIGWAGMKPMTDEALVAIDPDVILVMENGLASAGGIDGLLEAQPSVALTTAGEKRRIISIDDTLILGNGTRVPDVLDGLARALYAPDSLAG
ncbi:heme/hemin ABC transporter substrate-binding protein [Leucobacter sp. M11]|uniref:heme/hemin ABC transporter substrate-binding protein n=1 Tax=Leucobacter sp. M11 TaxID=2993565 RepID=UPI002D8056DF|nr:ABC transporter substrate-binding protein [Leucobacter sp. M11]MEB4614148.1 ABC transporter substrate-binding protein [Leucobacter sp. M11]